MEGDDHGEAYTAIVWGVGLSHENLEVAGAEAVAIAEGNMCGAVMRGTVALPGSEATSRTKGSRRNLGDLRLPAAAKAVPGRFGKARSRSRIGRSEESDGSIVPMKPRTRPRGAAAEGVEGRDPAGRRDTVFSVKPFTTSRSEEGCHRAQSGQGQGAPPARGPAALLDLPCARRPAGGQIGTTG